MNKQVIVGLCNPKSPANVGAVMRAAGCYDVQAVRYTGERFARAAKYQTDTKNQRSQIPLTAVEDITGDLPAGFSRVCVEFAEGATPLPEFKHPANALYIFGPEDGSIAQSIVDKADAVVYVPTLGCMNLAATVNVLLYDRLAKASLAITHNTPADHNAWVRKSRDVNNRLVVR